MVLAGRTGAISVISRRMMPPSVPNTTRSSFMLSSGVLDLFSMTKFRRQRFSAFSMRVQLDQKLFVRGECMNRNQN